MPLYDYKCKACGHQFEVIQNLRDPLKRKCPECKKFALEQQLGAPAFRLQHGTPMHHTPRKKRGT